MIQPVIHHTFAGTDLIIQPPLMRNLYKRSGRLILFITIVMPSFLIPGPARAQYEHKVFTSNMLVEGRVYYGFLYAQHLELQIYQSHIMAFEVNFQKETYGQHRWERAFGYPIIGMGLWYSSLGNFQSLGSAIAVFPYINFPLFKQKKFMLNFRFALGVGYLTKKFDRITNYKDLAIGSHLNAAANLMLEARIRVSGRVNLAAGICLQHFSNGSLKLPNYGINVPMINAAVAYRLVRENKSIGDRSYPPTGPFEAIIRHNIEFNFGAAIGYKNMKSTLGESFLVYHFNENTFFPVSRKSQVGFGLDLSYDGSHVKILENEGAVVTNKLKILRPGINAAYELVMGKLCFILNLGYYLGGQEKSNGPLYEKLTAQYNFSNSLYASAMLKVHFGRADYIAWGLGYRFLYYYGKKAAKPRFIFPVHLQES
jgi:hypothetical protein